MLKIRLLKMGFVLDCLRFNLGKLAFPILEPIFKRWENQNQDVRKYLGRGLTHLGERKAAISLLNLNMVLSLKPNHFLALVSRGRLYLAEGKAHLAARDFIKASQISSYRFTHYNLYGEYLRSVNKDEHDLGASIVSNFTETLESISRQNGGFRELKSTDVVSSLGERSMADQRCEKNKDHAAAFKRSTFRELDREKFDELGPITQGEIEAADWDQLIQDLTS